MLNNKNRNCILCGQIPGGVGAGYSDDKDLPSSPLDYKICFSKTTPTEKSNQDESLYFYISTSDNKSSLTPSSSKIDINSDDYGSDENDARQSMNVPGGFSFGKGGSKDDNPTKGGGGCCNQKGGRDGAGGYFGLYY
jgi:hypothetical protein